MLAFLRVLICPPKSPPLTCRMTSYAHAYQHIDRVRTGLPLALCWRVYWPLKNLQVELFPLQIPQASREALEPRIWSHPTACTHRENTRHTRRKENYDRVKKKNTTDTTDTIKLSVLKYLDQNVKFKQRRTYWMFFLQLQIHKLNVLMASNTEFPGNTRGKMCMSE